MERDVNERGMHLEYPGILPHEIEETWPDGELRTVIIRRFGGKLVHEYEVLTTWDVKAARIEVIFVADDDKLKARGWINPIYSAQHYMGSIWRDALKVHTGYVQLLNG